MNTPYSASARLETIHILSAYLRDGTLWLSKNVIIRTTQCDIGYYHTAYVLDAADVPAAIDFNSLPSTT